MGGGCGEDGEYGFQEEKKKNRPRQKARKAKAMVAKKKGRTWDSSSNWREKKNRDEDYGNHNAAAAKKFQGISTFKGTKIIFD